MTISRTILCVLMAWRAAGSAAAADRVCPISTCDPALIGFRSIHGAPVSQPVRVDGRLDEPAWQRAPRLAGFIQSRPVPGAAARLRTHASVLIGEDALYVGVRASDPDSRRISAPYLRRDNEGQSNWIFVEVDSRRDRRSAFSFGLNPRGVQVDGVFSDDVNYDVEWNGIWQGAARVDEAGWTAEFRIPFSQLAFADAAAGRDTSWGFNVYRYSPHHGEASNWSPRFQGLPGCVSQFNELTLTLPHAPRRLELTPFVAPRLEAEAGSLAGSVGRGADFSVGLGPAFTLRAPCCRTLDRSKRIRSQINLTTFELFQAERRPFFVEGASAFAFNAGLTFVARGNSFLEETPFIRGASVGTAHVSLAP